MKLRHFLLAALVASAPSAARAEGDQFRQGAEAFAENCAACHGEAGRGGSGYANPIWGAGAQIRKFRTAMGLFEYHRDLMPFDDPTRVEDDVKWAITQFILANHGAMPREATLTPANARAVPITP